MAGVIAVRGAFEHNLKDVSVDIPKNRLVAFTGVSGSGKSSLVFDTLYAEAFRRFADASSVPLHIMGAKWEARATRPKFRSITGLPPALGLSQRQGVAGKLSTVGTISGLSDLFRVYFAAFGEVSCRHCDIPLEARTFSQLVEMILLERVGKEITISAPIVEKRRGAFAQEIDKFRQLGFSRLHVDGMLHDLQDDSLNLVLDPKKLHTIDLLIDRLVVTTDRRKRIERALSDALEHGVGVVKIDDGSSSKKYNTRSICPQCGESAPRLDPRHFSHSSLGQCTGCGGTGSNDPLSMAADLFPCKSCGGTRLSSEIPNVRVDGCTFDWLTRLPLLELKTLVESQLLPHAGQDRARSKVMDEIGRLLTTILKLGLGHLVLNRAGGSLGPGDLQRLRLAGMLSNRLRGALYVLDEPCQGLTRQEVSGLINVIRDLVLDGASVVAVEHHPVFLAACDEVFLMGPGAGIHGGQIVEQVSGKDLSAKTIFEYQKAETKFSEYLRFQDIKVRNLARRTIEIPQGKISLIRGAAGVGKSTFFEECLSVELRRRAAKQADPEFSNSRFCVVEATSGIVVREVTDVRPGSLVRTGRRVVAAALDVLNPLREIFSALPSSQVMGLTAAHFSWHSTLGRCPHCEGRGYIELASKYGAAVELECEVCMGTRLSARSLTPRFKGINFAELMSLSIEEAKELFSHYRLVESRLRLACQFGLGYVKMGQGMDSLSGGELQRLLLTLELKKSNLAGVWFLLLNPGTGLHAPDISSLGRLLQSMSFKGATFVLIENREEFFEYCDHLISF